MGGRDRWPGQGLCQCRHRLHARHHASFLGDADFCPATHQFGGTYGAGRTAVDTVRRCAGAPAAGGVPQRATPLPADHVRTPPVCAGGR